MLTDDLSDTTTRLMAALVEQGVSPQMLAVVADNPSSVEQIATRIRVLARGHAPAATPPRRIFKRTPLYEAFPRQGRITNPLYRNGIDYLEEVTAVPESKLMRSRGIGDYAMTDLEDALTAIDLNVLRDTDSRKAALRRLYGSVDKTPLRVMFYESFRITAEILARKGLQTAGQLTDVTVSQLATMIRVGLPRMSGKDVTTWTVYCVRTLDEVGLKLKEE